MAQTNFSEESLKKLQELYNYCLAELVGGIRNQLIVLSGINVLFHYSIRRKFSDSCCSSQREFPSSAVQIPSSFTRYN